MALAGLLQSLCDRIVNARGKGKVVPCLQPGVMSFPDLIGSFPQKNKKRDLPPRDPRNTLKRKSRWTEKVTSQLTCEREGCLHASICV